MSSWKRLLWSTLGVVLVASALPVVAQQVKGAAATLSESIRKNQEVLQRYGWTSRMEVSVDDELKLTSVTRVHYGDDGTLERTEVPGAGAESSGGKKKTKKKQAKAEAFIEDLRVLAGKYVLMSPARMREVVSKGSVWRGDIGDQPVLRVVCSSVVHLNDRMEIRLNSITERPLKLEVTSSLRGAPVRIVVDFADLPDGEATSPAKIRVDAKSDDRKYLIRIENSDYVEQGSG